MLSFPSGRQLCFRFSGASLGPIVPFSSVSDRSFAVSYHHLLWCQVFFEPPIFGSVSDCWLSFADYTGPTPNLQSRFPEHDQISRFSEYHRIFISVFLLIFFSQHSCYSSPSTESALHLHPSLPTLFGLTLCPSTGIRPTNLAATLSGSDVHSVPSFGCSSFARPDPEPRFSSGSSLLVNSSVLGPTSRRLAADMPCQRPEFLPFQVSTLVFSASHQSIPLTRGMFYSRMFGDRLCCTTSPSATPRSLPLHVFVPALVLTSPQLGGITDHLAIIYVAPQRGVLHLSLLLGLAFFGLPQVNS